MLKIICALFILALFIPLVTLGADLQKMKLVLLGYAQADDG